MGEITVSAQLYNKLHGDSVKAGTLLRVIEQVRVENRDRDRDDQIDAIPISDICVIFGWEL